MKNLSLLTACLLLSGCIFTAKFDSVEYSYVTQIKTLSQVSRSQCANTALVKPRVLQIHELNLSLVNYSEYLPNNEPTYKMAKELLNIVEPMKVRYSDHTQVSKSYCELKFDNIEESTTVMQQSMNKRSR
jgi:hypothetical protein